MNADFKINGKVLETERLILRPFALDDLDDLFEYASIDGVGERAGWSHHQNKEKSLEILNSFIKEDKTFAIVLKEENKVIGSLGVEKYTRTDELPELNDYIGRELGYVLSKPYWGKGLMPEAVKRVIDYLFDELEYDFLVCGYFDFNAQSKRVQEKCGFKPYKRIVYKTIMGVDQPSVLTMLINPNKTIKDFVS